MVYWVAALSGSLALISCTIAMGAEWSGQSGDTTLVTKGDGIVCVNNGMNA